jgi:hypothetical protein
MEGDRVGEIKPTLCLNGIGYIHSSQGSAYWLPFHYEETMWQSDALAYCNAMREIAESQQIQVLVYAVQRVVNARFECNGDHLNQKIMFDALDGLIQALEQMPEHFLMDEDDEEAEC